MMQAWAEYLDAPRSAHDTQRSTSFFSRIASTHLVPEQTGVDAPQLSAWGNQRGTVTAGFQGPAVTSSPETPSPTGRPVTARYGGHGLQGCRHPGPH